ncbi:MAG: glycosyltransferase family 4 protein [Sphingopyxis sp.]
MSASIWYISKYFGLPTDQVGVRPFMLMREFARSGIQTMIFAANLNHLFGVPPFEGRSALQQVEGIDICWIKIRPYKGANSLGRIFSWLEFEWQFWRLPKQGFTPPDAIIISSLSLLTVLNGLLLRRRYKCRLIFEIRDIWPLTLVEEGGFSRWNPLVIALQFIERLGYKRSDAIVGTMPNLEEHVHALLRTSPPVHCIPMGVDDSQLAAPTPLPDDYVREHIPADKFIICHAGTIGGTNALGTLIETARLMADNPEVHFLIAGGGDLKTTHQLASGDLPNVTFAPLVPKAMVQSLLQKCDLLYFSTHPSKVWVYGQSLNKVIDYMLAGRPIVASYSGFPSMINEAGCGTFVQAADTMSLKTEIERYCAMSEAERTKMGLAAREWLKINRHYRDLAKKYLSILLPGRSM